MSTIQETSAAGVQKVGIAIIRSRAQESIYLAEQQPPSQSFGFAKVMALSV